MKKLILVILFSLIISNYSFSQWTWQNPLPHGNQVNSVKFINNNTGWYFSSVTSNYKTTNGGLNWNYINFGITQDIVFSKSYKFDSSNFTVFLGGSAGAVLISTNSGATWNNKSIPDANSISDIYFINNLTGFVAATKLYKTTDGGNNWTVSFYNSGTYARTMEFLNNNTGFIIGYQYQAGTPGASILSTIKTTDFGATWSTIHNQFSPGPLNPPSNLKLIDSTNCIISYAGGIYKTTDFGTNWDILTGIPAIYDFTNLYTGFATGNNRVYKSTNSGFNWTEINSSFIANYSQYCISAPDANNLFLAGAYGNIIKTSDGGSNWSFLNSKITNNGISAIQAIDSLRLFALAPNRTLMKTTNSGGNWSVMDSTMFSLSISSMFFINSNTGWLGNSTGVYKTTNAGINWSLSVTYGVPVTNIKFFNSGTGYAMHTNSALYKSTNFGDNWTQVYQLPSGFTIISFVDEQTGFIGRDYVSSSYLWRTTNGGNNWSPVDTLSTYYTYKKIKFYNANTGWASLFYQGTYPYTSSSFFIRKTTNGGLNWSDVSLVRTGDFYDMFIVNQNIIYVSDYWGNINVTTNAGLNWQSQLVSSSKPFSISCFNKDIWISGEGGMILKGSQLVPIGINSINSSLPSSFYLSQNYPNPFNPTTNIKYQITGTPGVNNKLVTLKIYDVLGKEIETLVNEKQSPGTYEVTWDGSNYPSGVYFYKLTAGDFTETKKMILLK